MKRLLVLTSNINDYNPKRIREEGEKLGLRVETVQYHDLTFAFGSKQEGIWADGKEILSYDYLILRGTGAGSFNFNPQRDVVVRYVLGEKIRVLNRELFLRFPGGFDKLMQSVVLAKAGLPVIRTKAYGYYDQVVKNEKELPYILKTISGSHGSGVKKVVSERGKRYFMGVYAPWKTLYQPFLRTGEDYRVIVIGSRVLGVMKRIAREGEYLTNVSAGGRFEKAEITKELEGLALRAAKAFSAEFCGVDVMHDDKEKPYILEVNKAAEFKGFEACTGLNVAGGMVKYLLDSH